MMKLRIFAALLALSLAMASLLSGCAGTSTGLGSPPLSGIADLTSSDPENPDGSHRWVARFTAAVTGTCEVQMLQGGVDWLLDPYVMVFEGDFGPYDIPSNAYLVAWDDNSGPGNDALASFYAYAGQVYTVWFTTYGPDDFGTFVYAIYDYTDTTTASIEPADTAKVPVLPEAKLKQD